MSLNAYVTTMLHNKRELPTGKGGENVRFIHSQTGVRVTFPNQEIGLINRIAHGILVSGLACITLAYTRDIP